MDSRRSLWHCIPITLSFSFGVSAPIIAQEQERLSLPLPIHPERYEEDPAESLPKESQPDRTSRDVEKASLRASSVRTPIPGQPGRNLPPIGESLETADGETKLGILDFVPHTYRNGGIRMEFIYTGETFTKARGGLTDSRRTNYRSNFDMVATLDTELMDWWDGGRLFVYGQNLSGDPLSASHVGDVQLFSNLDSTISDTERPHFTTIAEYWYEQLYLDGAIRLKMGSRMRTLTLLTATSAAILFIRRLECHPTFHSQPSPVKRSEGPSFTGLATKFLSGSVLTTELYQVDRREFGGALTRSVATGLS